MYDKFKIKSGESFRKSSSEPRIEVGGQIMLRADDINTNKKVLTGDEVG